MQIVLATSAAEIAMVSELFQCTTATDLNAASPIHRDPTSGAIYLRFKLG